MRRRRKAFVAAQTPDSLRQLALDLAGIAAPHVAAFKQIGSYAATGTEIDPSLITGALQKHARIALPRVTSPATPMTFHEITAGTRLEKAFANILAPPEHAPQVQPDILLVPLVGVDRHGVRLGQGQGHYDATIAALRARGRIFVLGLAYDCQLVDVLPSEPHDQRLDGLATPSRYRIFC